MCTVVRSRECGESMNGPSETNLATSRVKRCTFTYTKGGQSIERGGGQASDIIRRFEERKEKLTIISHTGLTVQTVSRKYLLYLLGRYPFKTSTVENFQMVICY